MTSILNFGSVQAAKESVEAFFAFSQEVSAAPITDNTDNGEDTTVGDEFTRLAVNAEQSTMLAMDDIDGPTLTHFDIALFEVGEARRRFFEKVTRNRVNAHVHADNANRSMQAGIVEFVS